MGHLMKDTPLNTHMAPVHTPITGFLMLLRISLASAHAKFFTHTSSSRRSPRPCQELALCLGPSPGCWVAVRDGMLRVLGYLFVCKASLHIPDSDYPWGPGGGTRCCRLGL